ncbi:MAG TPA: 4-hydroxy-3-methylbut-2-enyl diphosphate reductase, partial [Candidatus Baltobacteraceae bacterium]|nr:4-hydroxy-3-methylbut-2-enyl diphosphate reductase [Candidatus Baltobacteraceae bacterium]
MRRIVVCRSRGFCAGVERAVNVIDDLVHAARETIYVRKEVVHNRLVVEDFKRRGVVFVDEVEDAPAEALLVFSAHGVSPEVRHRAKRLRQRTIDATCPLVTKVHREVQRFVKLGCSVFLVGHGGHEEVEGILGHAGSEIHLVQNASEARAVTVENPNHVGVVTQTTLSLREAGEIIEILRRRFPLLREPPRRDICYATENRQAAVRALAETAQ